MVLERQHECSSQWKAIESIAKKLQVNHETLRQWARRVETDMGDRPGVTADERARMKALERENAEGLSGARRGKTSMIAAQGDDRRHRPADLVDRKFRASAPDRLWVADLTYVKAHSGWVYVAFIIDVYSRMIVGWQASRSLRSDLAIDALEMAVWNRRRVGRDRDQLFFTAIAASNICRSATPSVLLTTTLLRHQLCTNPDTPLGNNPAMTSPRKHFLKKSPLPVTPDARLSLTGCRLSTTRRRITKENITWHG